MALKSAQAFFIGWAKKPPKGLRPFLWAISAVLIGAAAGVSFGLGVSVPDPGSGSFQWGAGYQVLEGVVESKPYPVLRVKPEAAGDTAKTILLSGVGKRGVQTRADPLDGQNVKVGGVMLERGSISMLQVGGKVQITPLDKPADSYTPQAAEDLGKWRLTGEICDGKCYSGAMRPGIGLAHKACANLCIIGGIPPVFVTTGAVQGTNFFLLADPAGNPVPEAIYDVVGRLVTLEGNVERRDDLLVFKADFATVKYNW
ncbi:hypothetical protein E1162_07790 [Rhodobacteraceae bacterium RKSG542]|uniref:hypothetical protein n=1 Tax=Pseudovibrio flavus TaxID=2529854 RepID=UPI0012BCF74E|nr:hypothetical protein [Pseudovibrio flavus]MTI17141.1 hypothetical protein [Pseudovibrio flavus]